MITRFYALSLALIFLANSSLAQSPELLREIATSPLPSVSFSNFVSQPPLETIVTRPDNSKIYHFLNSDTEHGTELWRSDGTSAGTFMLADLEPGSGSSSPYDFHVFNNILYFLATTSTDGRAFFSSDGNSITLRASISTNPVEGFNSILTNETVNNRIFLNATRLDTGSELWRHEGNTTILFSDIAGGTASSNPFFVGKIGNRILFAASRAAEGKELWRITGNGSNVSLLKDINPGPEESYIQGIGNIAGDKFVFAALTSASGFELWVTDSLSAAGTSLVTEISPNSGTANPYRVGELNGALIIGAQKDPSDRELWRTDGTPGGTYLLKDINTSNDGYLGSDPSLGVNIGSQLVFQAYSDVGLELWKTDGTPGGTSLLFNLQPDPFAAGIAQFIAVADNLYLIGNDGLRGQEIFKFPPNLATPPQIIEIVPGENTSLPIHLARGVPEGKVFAFAHDPSGIPSLFSIDVQTNALTNITSVANFEKGRGSNPASFKKVGNRACFRASEALSSGGLYCSDGTAQGTVAIKSNLNITEILAPAFLPGGMLFGANSGSQSTGFEPWVSDGTTAGTKPLLDIAPGFRSSNPQVLKEVSGRVFFIATKADFTFSLYVTDGTTQGTVELRNFTGIGNTADSVGVFGSRLAFSAIIPGSGYELWLSDGTAAGTLPLLDINQTPGAGSNPSQFIEQNGKLYFTADNGIVGREIWVSDGTPTGTSIVVDLTLGSGSGVSFSSLFPFNGEIYFSGTNSLTIQPEIWKTNGTAAGTVLVKDIAFGNNVGSFPRNFMESQGTLYFSAYTPEAGTEVWKSDGTGPGTSLLKDVNPGPESSLPSNLTTAAGFLYFIAQEPQTGPQLWRSDGTESGTVRASSFDFTFFPPSTYSGGAKNAVGINDQVYLQGFLTQTGSEPFIVRDSCPSDLQKFASGACGCGVLDLDSNANGLFDCLAGPTLKQKLGQLLSLLKQIKNSSTKKNKSKVKKLKAQALPLAKDISSLAGIEIGSLGISPSSQSSLLGVTKKLSRFVKAAFKINATNFAKQKKTAIKNVTKALKAF